MFYFSASFYIIRSPNYGAFGICRCGPMSYPSHRPFFCDPTFYPSPPKTWDLPSYANDTAIELASGFYRTIVPKSYPVRCIEFCDIEAVESDLEDSSDGS